MSAPYRSIPLATPGRLAGAVAAVAAADAALAWRLGASPALPAYLAFGAAAGVVSVSDLVARRVPNRVTAPLYVAGAGLLGVASVSTGQWWPLARAGVAMAALGGFYLFLGLAFEAGVGMGDVKWAGAIGLFCGWDAWQAVVTATLLAFAAASVFVLGCHAVGRGRNRLVPMAPFMAAGAICAILLAR
jgi:leader peptidase (prepilin peptidase)/N-methyltransferase